MLLQYLSKLFSLIGSYFDLGQQNATTCMKYFVMARNGVRLTGSQNFFGSWLELMFVFIFIISASMLTPYFDVYKA
jgi:hypothetical protein